MKAVVLAAGEGVRLRPITSTRPKHLIRVGGKPILEHCIEALKTSGIDDILIVVHYMGKAICDYFGAGEKYGVKIKCVKQKAVLGTGNAVIAAEPYVEDDFLLVYGDLLFTEDVARKVVSLHKKEKPAVTMSIIPVKNPEDYGIVELKDARTVKRIVEKPSRMEPPTNLANAGIYAFSKEIFGIIRETSASARGEWEITDAISLLLKKERQVSVVRISGEDWFDIGRPWDLLEGNRWALMKMRHRVNGNVENGAHLIGPVNVAETARIRSGAYIEGPASVGENSDVGPNCYIRPCTSIGNRVRIGNACEIKNSIIMDETHIGHLSYIGDCIVGENCNLGAGTVTANFRLDGGTVKMSVKNTVVDSGRRKLGAVLGDNVKAGINVLFMPGVKVGSNSWIGPNVIVYRDLSADTMLLLKQDVEERKLGSQ
jgi:UDP-N-acetylglucosamine diphosphorylase/glucosamine-1-phosphate N-acetyltransferase